MTPKEFREKKGWTLEETARKLGIQGEYARRTYQRYETGVSQPPLDVIVWFEEVSRGRVRVRDWPRARAMT